jgi:Reverse transcriptase (RNA-dependent DNA polymerase)
VRLETIRAILAMVPSQKFKVQQMDVKGAYLNGTLKERVYMRQPEGHEDNSGRVCMLVKTLYSLKQSGHKWNIELDTKLQKCKFIRLKSDPCTYMHRDDNRTGIITVWVDDLLMFTMMDTSMETMKQDICSEWETTDLREPTKIIGIEITLTDWTVTIS